MTTAAPPALSSAASIMPEPLSTASQARIAAGRLLVWPDHVGIGEVHDNQVVAGLDGLDQLGADLGRGHFRRQVIGRDLGAWGMKRSSPGSGASLPPFQEEGDMGYFRSRPAGTGAGPFAATRAPSVFSTRRLG